MENGIKIAANMIGVNEQTIRVWIQHGLVPWGHCTKPRHGRRTYIVNTDAVKEWAWGITRDMQMGNAGGMR